MRVKTDDKQIYAAMRLGVEQPFWECQCDPDLRKAVTQKGPEEEGSGCEMLMGKEELRL